MSQPTNDKDEKNEYFKWIVLIPIGIFGVLLTSNLTKSNNITLINGNISNSSNLDASIISSVFKFIKINR